MISVVVPIFNVENYLEECLESLRRQTYTDIEVVMVNDGSTDSSPDIAWRYADADSRFRLITTPNAGPSAARNAGIRACSGQYFFFVDSDDCVHPQALEYLLEAAQRYPQADMVITRLCPSQRPCYSLGHSFALTSGKKALADTLYQKRGTHNSMSCRLVKSEALRRAGLMCQGTLYEDLDFCTALYLACPVVATSADILYFYRATPGSITRHWSERRLDVLNVTDSICRRLEENPQLRGAARSRRFSAYYNMFLLSTANNYPEGADRCWPVIKSYRRAMLADVHVRAKNKAGALASCLGRRFVSFLARYFAGI